MKKIITFVILALLGTTVSAETISFNRLNRIQLNDKIKNDSAFIEQLSIQLKYLVVGQEDLIKKLLIAILANSS